MSPRTVDVSDSAVVAFPMHGQWKLVAEGYRTRDGHFIEWFGRSLSAAGAVTVVSRPEPMILPMRYSWKKGSVAENTKPIKVLSARLPLSRKTRQEWWVRSLESYPECVGIDAGSKIACWNPFLGLSSAWPSIARSQATVLFDLLDDWTVHYAFAEISDSVEEAYAQMFSRADHVTANSEGTVRLAERFGRKDVEFISNGCDTSRFDTRSTAEGPLTIGYVGKIGRRLDLELIEDVCQKLPAVQFVFAGPVLDKEYRPRLGGIPNVRMLGDVHYANVPALLQTFDIGWVPHRVGDGEVGGDVIKTYEYRAAGLPVLTTPIEGAGKRSLDEVYVLEGGQHAAWLDQLDGPRVARRVTELPTDITWETKSARLLELLDRGRR